MTKFEHLADGGDRNLVAKHFTDGVRTVGRIAPVHGGEQRAKRTVFGSYKDRESANTHPHHTADNRGCPAEITKTRVAQN